ncbi:MAG: flagellar hook protein FlgL [Paracoccaceae bacterium]|nr:MAG: flagellar hook protein FlgL [Paracoccaceae bacterium]
MINGLPDLLSGLRLQHGGVAIRQRMETLSVELATGRKSDLVAASVGDPTRLYALEGQLARLSARAERLTMAEGRAEASQTALGMLHDSAGDLGVAVLGAIAIGDLTSARTHAAGARDAFEQAVGALNTRFGGRSLFAGAAVDGPALADANTILAALTAEVDAAATTADALAAIEAFFDDPAGGFATLGYLGATQDAPGVDLGPEGRVDHAVRADAQAIRDMLRGLATLVIAAEHPIAAEMPAAAAFYQAGGEGLIAARDGIARLRADLGVDQARIEAAATATAAESGALEILRARMVSRDPVEAAAEFQALETQMQAVYTVTARLSGLSLTNFLR